MDRVYIYKSHQFNYIFMKDRLLSAQELYCRRCEDSDTLLCACDTEDELDRALRELLKTHDLTPCENYDELMGKYGPKEGT
jgi:hypothetical protein